MKLDNLDTFTEAYIETALWSSKVYSEDESVDPTPMDDDYSASDLSEQALKVIVEDCTSFQEAMYENCPSIEECYTNTALAQMGHEFWLTRNGHGTGFWDGDYPEQLGKELTELAKGYGKCDLYIGDDGEIHVQ